MIALDAMGLEAASRAFREAYDEAVCGPVASLAVFKGTQAAIRAYLKAVEDAAKAAGDRL